MGHLRSPPGFIAIVLVYFLFLPRSHQSGLPIGLSGVSFRVGMDSLDCNHGWYFYVVSKDGRSDGLGGLFIFRWGEKKKNEGILVWGEGNRTWAPNCTVAQQQFLFLFLFFFISSLPGSFASFYDLQTICQWFFASKCIGRYLGGKNQSINLFFVLVSCLCESGLNRDREMNLAA